MRPDLNIVTEYWPGVFGAIMWAPTSRLLADLLHFDYPHVLVWNHYSGHCRWESFRLPIITPTAVEAVLSRGVYFDFVIPTPRFRDLLPKLGEGISAVQLRQAPPDYLELNRIRGPERFRLLGECGWHVLLETPANDYGQVFSPDRDVVVKAVQLHQAAETATV